LIHDHISHSLNRSRSVWFEGSSRAREFQADRQISV